MTNKPAGAKPGPVKNTFTKAQQAAIDCDATNILVSAAAGSGKTAVLTERILRHIKCGVDIDNLLVVTFTEAASAEMRERIAKKLQDAGQTSQLARLPMANISTIHSFFRKLVQEHFQAVDIDPAFRVGDTAELSLIRTDVMNEVFEQEYAAENKSFTDLADVYGGKTLDGRLDVLVRKIHDFMESDPFPKAAARRYAAMFSTSHVALEDTPWAKVVRDELALGLEGALEGIHRALAICHKAGGPDKYVPKLEEELDWLEDLQQYTAPDSAFDAMYKKFTYDGWGRLPAVTAKDDVDPDLKKQAQDIRDDVKKRIKKLVEGVFFAPPDKMQADLSALAPRVAALMAFATKFSEAFAAEKRARNLLDFSDLEHFAIRILYPNAERAAASLSEENENGDCAPLEADMTPAPIHQFYEVLIDEYQDSNAVQDLILFAVAQRRFMVGDVKQSIYRFRRANPGLFMQKYKDYADGVLGTRIDLSHNFRSRPEVLDAVNFFFSQLMCEKVGEVTYDNHAALHPGHDEYPKLPAPDLPPQMWVELLDQHEEEAADVDSTDEETPDNIAAETRVIAKCIRELLDTRQVWDNDAKAFRPCKPRDIAVITRGLSAIAGTVIDELKSHGIDAIADMDASFLEQIEVKTALAFLRIIDNPRQDIHLVTALLSPIYDITEDDLVEIKQAPLCSDTAATDICFFDYLTAFSLTQTTGDLPAKVHRFLADLATWRRLALYLPVSRLIGQVYSATQYPSHVLMMPSGNLRQANLRLLLERAIEFEETSYKGLFQFIHYIERLYASDVKSSGAIAEPSPSPDGRVRLMTIHKSKGLEFPVVICAFLGKQFNTDDMRQPVILHSEMGIGPYYVDTALRTRANTLARFSLANLSARENLSEELRCLYVAMTRAKELLVLTARSKNLDKAIQKWANVIGGAATLLPAYYLAGVKSYLDWVMPCLMRHRSAAALTTAIEVDRQSGLWHYPVDFRIRVHKQSAVAANAPVNNADAINLDERDTGQRVLAPFSRSETEHTALPSKLSISEIKRLYDMTPDSTVMEYGDTTPTFDPPDFIKAKSGPTPMQMGSALHTVAEHLDYKAHTTLPAINDLIYDLAEKNLLTPEEAAFIDRDKIETLVRSHLAQRIRQAPRVYRETPFILALPAAELYPNNPHAKDEKVLVHGIIDCYFEEDGEIVLVDFKSDAQPGRHAIQMAIYKKAVENSTGLLVKEVLIYSFALGEAVGI